MANETLERVVSPKPLLTDLAIDESAVPESFILERVAPNYEVDSYRFDFPIYGKELLLAERDDGASVRGEYKETQISQNVDSGELEEHGLKAAISKRERLEARRAEQRGQIDPEFQLEVRTAAAIRMQVKRRREYLGAQAFLSPAGYSAGHTDDTIDPLGDTPDVILGKIGAMREKIISDSGFIPNVAIIGDYVREAFTRNAGFRAFLPSDRVQVVTQDALAEIFRVERVEWGTPVVTASVDSEPRPVYDDVFWLGYINPNTNSKQPTFARTFFQRYEDGRDAYSGTVLHLPEGMLWVWYAEMYQTIRTGPDLGALAYGMRANA